MPHTPNLTLLMKVEILQKMHHETDTLKELAGQVSSADPIDGACIHTSEHVPGDHTRVEHHHPN